MITRNSSNGNLYRITLFDTDTVTPLHLRTITLIATLRNSTAISPKEEKNITTYKKKLQNQITTIYVIVVVMKRTAENQSTKNAPIITSDNQEEINLFASKTWSYLLRCSPFNLPGNCIYIITSKFFIGFDELLEFSLCPVCEALQPASRPASTVTHSQLVK